MKKLFDIFSRSKSLDISPKILVDHREKSSLVPSFLKSLNILLEFQQLKIGDYIINKTAIERKTFSDLQSSIINKRIFQQLENLKSYPSSLLIIEGFPSKKNLENSRIHKNAIKGFILSAALDSKIPIIFTENPEETASYLYLLAKRSPNKNPSIRQSQTFSSKEEQIQHILEGFPGIGPIAAKKLISHFKTLKNIFNSSQKDLQKLIGKKSKAFQDLLN